MVINIYIYYIELLPSRTFVVSLNGNLAGKVTLPISVLIKKQRGWKWFSAVGTIGDPWTIDPLGDGWVWVLSQPPPTGLYGEWQRGEWWRPIPKQSTLDQCAPRPSMANYLTWLAPAAVIRSGPSMLW